ncbi:hypothetical protein G9A89_010620 [Geosiphon pyriformis]|nr:hypothetical protein G9A89_010620 [Geosiphon pyriformis]
MFKLFSFCLILFYQSTILNANPVRTTRLESGSSSRIARANFNGQSGGVTGEFTFLKKTQDSPLLVNLVIKTGLKDITGDGYPYHVHQYQIGENFNCTDAGGHLDPTNAAKTYSDGRSVVIHFPNNTRLACANII